PTIWASSNTRANLQIITKQLSDEQRAQMIDDLKHELASASAQRVQYARNALYYLDKTAVAQDTPNLVLVDHALAQCARSPDRYLREHVAMALNFWDGDLVEETLLRLARDDGFGTLIRVAEGD